MVFIEEVKEFISPADDKVKFEVKHHVLDDAAPRPAGSEFDIVFDPAHRGNVDRICQVICEISGQAPEELDEEGADFAMGEENPLHGTICKVQIASHETKNGFNVPVPTYTVIDDAAGNWAKLNKALFR